MPVPSMSGSPATESAVQRGLQDVVALSSRICFIDGKQGRLLYQGYDIRDLAASSTFEEVAFLLWNGRLPTGSQLSELSQRLVGLRMLPPQALEILRTFPKESDPMDVLRTMVSVVGLLAPDESQPGAGAIGGAQRFTAVLPAILGEFHRHRQGLPPLEPRPDLSHAAWLLFALRGKGASALEAQAIDVALILHADHELNASTFAARVTASTLSDLGSAITSAVGTLKGPLHGGANERVMELLDEIGSVEKADEVIHAKLAARQRIMGFGHRVYKVEDPRATILRKWSQEIGEDKGDLHYYELLRKVEEAVHREKGLYPNVDLYSGSVYTLLGLPRDLFTPIFAVSRVAGWTAHVLEEYDDLRLIRPTAEYIGPVDLKYAPITQRS
jgi:citrate synthase